MKNTPWFKFYQSDWLAKTRQLSHTSKSVWSDILSHLWNESGAYVRSEEQFLRENNVTRDELESVLTELRSVCKVERDKNRDISVTSRRVTRDIRELDSKRKIDRIRQERHRSKKHVTRLSRKCHGTEVEVEVDVDVEKESKSTTLSDTQNLDPGSIKPYRKPATPNQKWLVMVKQMMGVALEDRNWDKIYFGRFSKPSSEMMLLFKDNWRAAAACAKELSKGFEAQGLSWTPETIVKHAGQWISRKGGIENVCSQYAETKEPEQVVG